MPKRRNLLLSTMTVFAISLPFSIQAGERIKAVASFSILGDMVQRIGGEHVDLTTLVGANGDAHVYQPTPAAARAVSEAQLMFVNGLEFEGWLNRLSEAANFDGTMVVTTTGVEAIAYADDHHDEDGHDDHAAHGHDEHHDEHDHAEHAKDEHHDEHDHAGHDHGAFDPHAWQSLQAALIYAGNILAALREASPAHAETFTSNHAAYAAEIRALDDEIRQMFAALPEEQRTVVTSHDAFSYFGRDYGLTFLAPQGVSTESEASARDVAALIKQMRAEGISAVFVENIADARLLEQIARETGATIGGKLYPGALSGPDGPAPTYLEMMKHNALTLVSALNS